MVLPKFCLGIFVIPVTAVGFQPQLHIDRQIERSAITNVPNRKVAYYYT